MVPRRDNQRRRATVATRLATKMTTANILNRTMTRSTITSLLWLLTAIAAVPQNTPQPTNAAASAPQTALPAPLGLPKPGPTNDAPYAPQPILQGGMVLLLYPPGSPFLKADRAREAEEYNMSRSAPG